MDMGYGRPDIWRGLLSRLSTYRPEALDPETRDAAARLIADSLICSVAAAPLERSVLFRQALLPVGCAEEAAVFGTGLRTSSVFAASANAESANLLDADDTFLNGAHFGSLTVVTALAEAERCGASFARALLAVTVGFELNARLSLSHQARPGFLATGLFGIGAAAAAAVAADASPEGFDSAVGLAMRSAPGPAPSAVLRELGSEKYAPYATLAANAVRAARLGAAGYRADADLMVAECGFMTCQMAEAVEWDHLLAPVTDDWWIRQTSLKPYPLFRLGHPAIAAALRAVRTNSVSVTEIEHLVVTLDPRARALPFHETAIAAAPLEHLRPIHSQMNLRLGLALALLNVPPGPLWAAPAVVEAPDVRALVGRIVLAAEPFMSMSNLAPLTDPRSGKVRSCFARVVLRTARGQFEAEAEDAAGDPWSATAPPDWSFLARKARDFCGSAAIVERIRSYAREAPVGALLGVLD